MKRIKETDMETLTSLLGKAKASMVYNHFNGGQQTAAEDRPKEQQDEA
mgnify:CR=1 FL=1